MRDAYKDERVNVREIPSEEVMPWFYDPEPPDRCCNEGARDGVVVNKPLYRNQHARRN